MRHLRMLIWAYVLLLLFEGALRKWIVPALDAPLLIIRDPLVVWIYYEALRNRLSFVNAFFYPTVILAICTTIMSLLFGYGTLFITFYGVTVNYLQLPFIFLIPQILNRDDVIVIGRFFLYVSLPMAALVIFQFRASPDSLVNKGAMHTWYGTVRPSGTFSYIAGLVAYFALVAPFLFYGYLEKRVYPIWLLVTVTIGVMLSTGCSGSRTFIVSVGIVVVTTVVCVLLRGKGGFGLLVAAVLIALAVPILTMVPVFQDGTHQIFLRFRDGAAAGEDTQGFAGRYAGTMITPLSSMGAASLFGNGIGTGTNAASGLLTGNREFTGSEDEWGRLIFESGPIFGLMLILFRVALTLTLAKRAYDALREDNFLPILLLAGCGVSVLNGQWGVPTSLGFAIFGAGLTLAACNVPEDEEYDDEHEDGQHHEDEEHDSDDSEHSPATDTVA